MSKPRSATRRTSSSYLRLDIDGSSVRALSINSPTRRSQAGSQGPQSENGYKSISLAKKAAFKWLIYYIRKKTAKTVAFPPIVSMEHEEEIYSCEYLQPPEVKVTKSIRKLSKIQTPLQNYLVRHSSAPSHSFSQSTSTDVMSTNEREQLNERIKNLQNELKNVKDERDSYETKDTESSIKIKEFQKEIQLLAKEKEDFQLIIERFQTDNDSLKDAIDKTKEELNNQIGDLENEFMIVLGERNMMENKCTEINKRAESAQVQLGSLEKVNLDNQGRIGQLLAENSSLNDTIDATRNELNGKIKELEMELSKAKDERPSWGNYCKESTRVNEKLESEVQLLTKENMDWQQKIGQLILDNKKLSNDLKTTKDLLEKERLVPRTSGIHPYSISDPVLVWRVMSTVNEHDLEDVQDASQPVLTSIRTPAIDLRNSRATRVNWASLSDEEIPDYDADDDEMDEVQRSTGSGLSSIASSTGTGFDFSNTTPWTSPPTSLITNSSRNTSESRTTSFGSSEQGSDISSVVSCLPRFSHEPGAWHGNQLIGTIMHYFRQLRHWMYNGFMTLLYPFFHWLIVPLLNSISLGIHRVFPAWRPDDQI